MEPKWSLKRSNLKSNKRGCRTKPQLRKTCAVAGHRESHGKTRETIGRDRKRRDATGGQPRAGDGLYLAYPHICIYIYIYTRKWSSAILPSRTRIDRAAQHTSNEANSEPISRQRPTTPTRLSCLTGARHQTSNFELSSVVADSANVK